MGRKEAVRQRASDRCEYCRLPQGAFRRRFHIEHIIARQHGGTTSLDNLCIRLLDMQPEKGTQPSGIDPETGLVTALFHPREHLWLEHFSARVATHIPRGIEIRGLTPVGRTTVRVLALNEDMRQTVRYELWLEGLYIVGI